MSNNRIEACLNKLKEKNEKAFITYITAGLPNMDKTAEILKAQEMEKYYQKARDILIEYKEFLNEMVEQLKKKKILTNRDIFDMEDRLKIFGYASPQYERRAKILF